MKPRNLSMLARVSLALPPLLLTLTLQAIEADRSESHVSDGNSFAARSSAILATDCDFNKIQNNLATKPRLERVHQALTIATRTVPRVGRNMLKCLTACVCCVVLIKLCKVDCNSKKLDCRRCTCIAWFLFKIGYDEFPAKNITVTVHSVADIVNKGLLGGDKLFNVQVRFRWSVFQTSTTGDMRWEQTKGMEIPQGADCEITVFDVGKLKVSTLGKCVLATKRQMIDANNFWNEKQRLRLENDKEELVGTLFITFRGEGEGDGGGELPIEGIKHDSALAIAVRDAWDNMLKDVNKEITCSENDFKYYLANCPPENDLADLIQMLQSGQIKKPATGSSSASAGDDGTGPGVEASAAADEEMPKLEGNLKIDCLGRCITGPLREVTKNGKEGGKTFIRVIHCNYAELQGDDMKQEMAKQIKKAQEKGLNRLPKKWYWVWYEDKKAAYHEKNWHNPDGYVPMIAIGKVNRDPTRIDQFVITYTEDDDKKKLEYRRDAGKSLDVWTDGLDLCFNECRQQVKRQR